MKKILILSLILIMLPLMFANGHKGKPIDRDATKRNDTPSPTHYYAPFPGQISVPDFMKFYNDPYTLFEKDLKNIYKR